MGNIIFVNILSRATATVKLSKWWLQLNQ